MFAMLRRRLVRLRADEGGFSLTEMLASLVIVVLLSGVVSVAIAFGSKQYVRSLQVSEGNVLCSTLESAIRNELTYSDSVRADSSGQVEFTSVSYARNVGDTPYWHLGDRDGHVVLLRGSIAEPLLPDTAYANGLVAGVSCRLDDEVVRVEVLVSDADGSRKASSAFDIVPRNSDVELVERLDSV